MRDIIGKLWLQTSSQSLRYAICVYSCTYMHNLITTGYIGTFYVSNKCPTIGHILLGFRDVLEFRLNSYRSKHSSWYSLIQHSVYTASLYILRSSVHNNEWQQNSYSLRLCCTPNDSCNANCALFCKSQVLCDNLETASIHSIYSVQTHFCVFPITVDTMNTYTQILKWLTNTTISTLGFWNIHPSEHDYRLQSICFLLCNVFLYLLL